jgi:hypothetical protein
MFCVSYSSFYLYPCFLNNKNSNDPDPTLIDFRSAGIIKHAVESFDKIEKQLIQRQNSLDFEIAKLHQSAIADALHFNTSAISAAVTENATEAIHQLFIATATHIKQIKRRYEVDLHKPFVNTHLPEVIDGINRKFTDVLVLDIPLKQLLKLVVPEMAIYNSTIVVAIPLPLVSTNNFQNLFLVPSPNVNNSTIPDFQPIHVTINTHSQEYIDLPKLIPINATLAITEEPLIIRNKITANSSCELRSLLLQQFICKTTKLPADYDRFPTPAPNVIAFISNQNKIIKCLHSTTRVREVAGYIELPAGCSIETTKFVIIPSLDITKNILITW